MSGAPSRRSAATVLALALLFGPLAAVPLAGAFDPAVVANTANHPAFNVTEASNFRLNLENVTPYACPVNCTLSQSDEVKISIDGPERLTGTLSGAYRINVTPPTAFAENFTTIAAVIQGNASDVVLQADAQSERTGSQAYTKDLNGTSTMNITLLPSNRSGNITINVIAYVGNGNRTNHNDAEVYQIASKNVQMRAQRLIPLNATIQNRANISVTSVNVSFWARGPTEAEFTPVGNATLAAVGANGTAEAGVAWDATWADRTIYTVKVVVDPLHQHPDAFEEDNVAFFRVNLGDPEPDTRAQAIGNAFLYGTIAVLGLVAFGLWWYNSRYE